MEFEFHWFWIVRWGLGLTAIFLFYQAWQKGSEKWLIAGIIFATILMAMPVKNASLTQVHY